jgi:hypothetical protein
MIDIWSKDSNVSGIDRHRILNFFNLKGDNLIGIEIGVHEGRYARVILENTDLHLIMLDSWRHIYDETYRYDGANSETIAHLKLLEVMLKEMTPVHEGRFTVIRELSEIACNFFKDDFFDFIYLDANHSEEFVFNELNRWWPKLKVGGVMAGHDYLNLEPIFGVKTAVDRFFYDKGIEFFVCDTGGCCPTWYVKK